MDKAKKTTTFSIIAFRSLAEFGDILFLVIANIQVYNLSPTGTSLAILMIVKNLPIILLGVFAGTVVDRMRKSKLILICLCLMSLLIFLAGIRTSMGDILVIMGVYRTVYAFYKPARSAIIPSLLKQNEILKCISSSMVVQEIATMSASLLVARLFITSIPTLIILALASMVISIFIVSVFLRTSEDAHGQDTVTKKVRNQSFLTETWEGWKYLLHDKALKLLAFIVALIWLATGGFSSIQIVYLTKRLSVPSHWVGLTESIVSVGNLVGFLIVTIVAGRSIRQRAISSKMGVGYLVAGAMMALSALTTSFTAFCLCLLLHAIGDGFSNAIEESFEQRLPGDGQVGKSISIISTIGSIGYIIGTSSFPLLTDHFPVEKVIVLSACCMLITGIAVSMNIKTLLPKDS